MKPKAWFSKQINKIDKLLIRLLGTKKKKAQITNTKNERVDITIVPPNIKKGNRRLLRCYLDEMSKFF